ncbi:hypothetical protein [Sulfurirhabdus autotrophica]|uniref:Uncharacterized protein n=1 Tax=Sulfurirhabdus autotrophica TaxID=1706046 RepID=A0A4R3Y4H2_9PROT|nr:hypothetical protein [Sulfurirhabdus autotrophica]TCV86666.1 hypothetical protein EDC63_10627 [Sulfurirhabdus autotrophica]
MENHKKIGMIVMVASVALVAVALAMTESYCPRYETWSSFDFLMKCWYVNFFSDSDFFLNFYLKYALAFCVTSFGTGFLWYQGVFKGNENNK